MHDIEDQIFSNLGREAKPYEIADILGISLNKVIELQTLRRLKEKESLEQIDDNRKNIETIIASLSDNGIITETIDGAYIKDGVYIDEEDTLPEGFRIRDRVQDQIMAQMLSKSLENVLLRLDSQQREVLLERFGFADGRVKTLEEVGRKYGYKAEKVRQIERKAIRKLRHPSLVKEVKGYIR